MKKRFSEEQIIGFLREAEAGIPIKELCRKHGFSEASFYLWRSKFGGMSVPDAKRLLAGQSHHLGAWFEGLSREGLLHIYAPSIACCFNKTCYIFFNKNKTSRQSRVLTVVKNEGFWSQFKKETTAI